MFIEALRFVGVQKGFIDSGGFLIYIGLTGVICFIELLGFI